MTNENPNSVPITKLLEVKIASLEDKIAVQFIASETARKLAVENLANRLETLNHLREQVEFDRATYMTREQYESNHEALRIDMSNQKDRINEMNITNWPVIIAAMVLVSSIIGGLWFTAINPINLRLDQHAVILERDRVLLEERGTILAGIDKDIKFILKRLDNFENKVK